MRCPLPISNARKILCVFPAYAPSFGTFSHAYHLFGRVRAFMPPQGLLLIAAYMPEPWPVRFIDENIGPASAADFAWADIVMVSGMHVQAPQIYDIARRAKAAGKVTVLGGPSVSGAPEMYPDFDYLHVGEIGEATDKLLARLDEDCEPPPAQVRFETIERLPLSEFPVPAYHLIRLDRYLLGSLQFSSGCPYRCEFCDIPALYGRQPRLKMPAQLAAELDAMLAQGSYPSFVYFVDDNFIGNRKATREMLPHLIAWQKRRGHPLRFGCEATLNLAKQPEILALMRERSFTPYSSASKLRKSMRSSICGRSRTRRCRCWRRSVRSTATASRSRRASSSVSIPILPTPRPRLKAFIDASNVPILTINLLQALPKTPLWDRLKRDGRIVADDGDLESNVRFLRPYGEVVAMWRRCIAHAYAPERLFERFARQVEGTYANRLIGPVRGKLTWNNLSVALVLACNIAWRIGVFSDYRRWFWKAVLPALRRGQIDAALSMGVVAHHMITFSREALRGEQNASFYSAQPRRAAAA